MNETIHACVLKWNDDVMVPLYKNYFTNNINHNSADLIVFLISLSGSDIDIFVEDLTKKFDPTDLIEYCNWMLKNDLYKYNKKSTWPEVLADKPFPRYLICVSHYLIFNLSEKNIDLAVLKNSLWESITIGEQKYWPEYLHDLLLPVFSNIHELFVLALKTFIEQDKRDYKLAEMILYGFHKFNNIEAEIKKKLFNEVLLQYDNAYKDNIRNLKSYLFPSIFSKIKSDLPFHIIKLFLPK